MPRLQVVTSEGDGAARFIISDTLRQVLVQLIFGGIYARAADGGGKVAGAKRRPLRSRKKAVLEAVVEAAAEQMPIEIGLVGEDVGREWDGRWAEGREIGAGGLDSGTEISPEVLHFQRPMVSAANFKLNAAAAGPASQ